MMQSISSLPGRVRDRLPAGGRLAYDIIADTITAASEDELPLFAPALAFSLVVSVGPLMLAFRTFGINIVDQQGAVPGQPLASLSATELIGDFGYLGPLSAAVVFVMLLWGASRMFSQLAEAIHRVWHDPKRGHSGLLEFFRRRGLAVVLLATLSFALFASAILGNALAAAAGAAVRAGGGLGVGFAWLESVASSRVLADFLVAALFCTATFVAVPHGDQKVAEILPGAMITAAAYALGQLVLGRYLASNPRLDALGMFGSFVAFLLWAYYTALIVLWGAELTHQIARRIAGDD